MSAGGAAKDTLTHAGVHGAHRDTLTHQLAFLGVDEGTELDQRVDNSHLLPLDRLVHGAGAWD